MATNRLYACNRQIQVSHPHATEVFMTEEKYVNALINETSPYLLQHAHNPVDWYPWGEAALAKARQEDKPILLSIGYSACHWCHVMAHESFEDQATAKLMNELFVNIKVDREERPDLDRIYQVAQQLITRRTGGWPLTMFLHPENHLPFYGGTYFPPDNRYGMPGFAEVLRQVADFYRQEQEAIRQQNVSMQDALQQIGTVHKSPTDAALNPAPLHNSIRELQQSFDHQHGGFGDAPKFPMPANIEILLHQYELSGGKESALLEMAVVTLRQMAQGGIYDQIGGGFCRYAVDEQWMIPHFEKMLYDNGPLLALYTRAWRLTSEPFFRQVSVQTADWIIREMQSPEGGFYSSLDADSEGVEGKFYVWTPEQVKDILTAGEYALFSKYSGLDRPANFEGKWHLFISKTIQELATMLNQDEAAVLDTITGARNKLYAARKDRIRPGRDEKILTAWNALAIKGLAIAAVHLERQDYLDAAERALTFIHANLWREGRLLATCRNGKAHLNAYLDDYAYLIDAILHFLQARWSGHWLAFAMDLADCLLAYFHDSADGGFFFTSHDHEQLIQRRKDFMDDALPSGNGIAASALSGLGYLVNDQRYNEAAHRTLVAAWPALERMPSAHNTLLFTLADYCFPPQQIILRGNATVLADWARQCRGLTDSSSRIYAIPANAPGLPEILEQRKPIGEATAYICTGHTCKEPLQSEAALVAYLKRQVKVS
jgi:hypothetical protein